MQLKISRSAGNYLVLNLAGAILTHFADPGPDCRVDLRLADGKEGDDQFRKFLAQAMEDETVPLSPAAASRIEQLEEENAELRQKVAELTACIAANVPRAGKPSAEHIFAGKSRAWLEGFAANRLYRLNLKECQELNSASIPVEPRNPYKADNTIKQFRSWAYGWNECAIYLVNEMPDPTSHLEQAK